MKLRFARFEFDECVIEFQPNEITPGERPSVTAVVIKGSESVGFEKCRYSEICIPKAVALAHMYKLS